MWFKLRKGVLDRQERMYLFTFKDVISCYFTRAYLFVCDNQVSFKAKIEVDIKAIQAEQWIHLTVSGDTQKNAYAQFSSYTEVLAIKTVKEFPLRKHQTTKWQACLGDCDGQGHGFYGGIREFLFLQQYTEPFEAKQNQNLMRKYSLDLKAYYRFNVGRFEFD